MKPHLASIPRPAYRRLLPMERHLFHLHLLRLGNTSRFMRFGNTVGDSFIGEYCNTAHSLNTVIYGAFVAGEIRACVELRLIFDTLPLTAELAFSVEDEWQNGGIGTALMEIAMEAARRRHITRLYLISLAGNRRVQSIARKFQATRATEAEEFGKGLHNRVPDARPTPGNVTHTTTEFVTYTLTP